MAWTAQASGRSARTALPECPGKTTVGRKRHILTDTLGLLLGIFIHLANIQDRDGAEPLLTQLLSGGAKLEQEARLIPRLTARDLAPIAAVRCS